MVFPVLEHVEGFAESEGGDRVRGEIVEPFGDVDGFSGVVLDPLDELVGVKDYCGIIGAEGFCGEGAFPGDAAAFVVRGSVAVELEGHVRFADVVPWGFRAVGSRPMD